MHNPTLIIIFILFALSSEHEISTAVSPVIALLSDFMSHPDICDVQIFHDKLYSTADNIPNLWPLPTTLFSLPSYNKLYNDADPIYNKFQINPFQTRASIPCYVHLLLTSKYLDSKKNSELDIWIRYTQPYFRVREETSYNSWGTPLYHVLFSVNFDPPDLFSFFLERSMLTATFSINFVAAAATVINDRVELCMR